MFSRASLWGHSDHDPFLRQHTRYGRLPLFAAAACAVGVACVAVPVLFPADAHSPPAYRPDNPRWLAMQRDRRRFPWLRRLSEQVGNRLVWCAARLAKLRRWLDGVPSSRVLGAIAGTNVWVFSTWIFGDKSVMMENYALSLLNVAHGRWWTIFTSIFSHRDPRHMFSNGISFFTIGPLVHNMLGNTSFLALYMFSGLTGSVAHLLFRPTISHGLGASGALYGLTAYFVCMHPDANIGPMPARYYIPVQVAVDVCLNVATSDGPHLGIVAHLGGAFGGWLFWRARQARPRRRSLDR